MTPQEERRKRLESTLDEADRAAGFTVPMDRQVHAMIVSLLEREIDAAVRQATVFNLCESGFVIPRPGQLYTYRVAPGCPKCEELAAPYADESPAAKGEEECSTCRDYGMLKACTCPGGSLGPAAHPKAGEGGER